MKYMSFPYKGKRAEIMIMSDWAFFNHFIITKRLYKYVHRMGKYVLLISLGGDFISCPMLFPAIVKKAEELMDTVE